MAQSDVWAISYHWFNYVQHFSIDAIVLMQPFRCLQMASSAYVAVHLNVGSTMLCIEFILHHTLRIGTWDLNNEQAVAQKQ